MGVCQWEWHVEFLVFWILEVKLMVRHAVYIVPGLRQIKITLLRVIPTMTFIHFLTGKSSGILSDISSGILSGISSGKCSGISSGISSGILSGKSSGILSGISSDICSSISSGILSGKSSGILSDISSGILSGISSGILFGRWGPAVLTGIWSSRLRSGSAHWDLELAVEVRQCPLRPGARGWGPAVPTGIWSSRWRSGCAHWDLDCEEEAAGEEAEEEEENSSDKIYSNNPHLAGGENDTKRCRPQKNFMKTMCTYMDRCRCAVVIWLWHKFFRSWGKLCATRWGKIIGCSVSYPPYSYVQKCFTVIHIQYHTIIHTQTHPDSQDDSWKKLVGHDSEMCRKLVVGITTCCNVERRNHRTDTLPLCTSHMFEYIYIYIFFLSAILFHGSLENVTTVNHWSRQTLSPWYYTYIRTELW